jgi:hypothetical protein
MKTLFLSLFILTLTQFSYSQNLLTLNGKVTAEQDDLSNIAILNKNQKYEKVTAPGGYFSIKVALNDTLVFTSDFLYSYEHIVSNNDFVTDLLQIRMIRISNLLQEVQVYKALDPVEFGIMNKAAKQFTPSERRLKTASSGPVDLIANTFNGKRKMFKTLIALENQSTLENKFISTYGRYNLEKDFQIPDEYIESFSQYACRNANVLDALKRKEKQKLSFLLIDVAIAYKKEFDLKE